MKRITNVRQLVENNKPVYVIVGGTMGAGKSTWVNQTLEGLIPVIDPDEIACKLANSCDQVHIRSFSHKALALKNQKIAELFSEGKSFVDMGTMANKNSTIKKVKLAREMGFTVLFVMVSTSPEESLRRNRKRIAEGGRGVAPEKEHRIQQAYDDSMETFETMKKIQYVNYIHEVKT